MSEFHIHNPAKNGRKTERTGNMNIHTGYSLSWGKSFYIRCAVVPSAGGFVEYIIQTGAKSYSDGSAKILDCKPPQIWG